jgi:hypothetical protein
VVGSEIGSAGLAKWDSAWEIGNGGRLKNPDAVIYKTLERHAADLMIFCEQYLEIKSWWKVRIPSQRYTIVAA